MGQWIGASCVSDRFIHSSIHPFFHSSSASTSISTHLGTTIMKKTTSPNFLATLTGSFAMPAAENPTVAMVEAAYRHHGLNWRYINCEVPPALLGDAVRGARAMGWAGFNCSI